MKKQLIYGNILTLLLGGMIYVFFRTSSLKMFSWLKVVGLDELTNEFRIWSLQFKSEIPNWVLFSLPDGLWMFSYITLILLIWKNSVSNKNIFWLLIIPIVAISSELGQLIGFFDGTFDLVDLLFYISGVILPFLLFYQSVNSKVYFFKKNQQHLVSASTLALFTFFAFGSMDENQSESSNETPIIVNSPDDEGLTQMKQTSYSIME